ncbi:glycosyltransferase family 4 protein [Domibacillus sp. PGB-M46]|uniref:glycosyltransferase family 4 protein n=1 Tax=Domibacillus sp. PGB-M46 TaxID=2910255 RepID=UPI001F56A509|nr:glycosyltransferase family 4 protein [Domibacillus sp. PGB-M46]MCI2256907.1 glycosyltransferase family 4 protein [Domibacillus sp. PGB-M46]
MKIALICSDRGPAPPVKGGAIQLLISKIAPLLAKTYEVTVFSITDPSLPDTECTNGVYFERYDKDQFFQQVCERVKQVQFDVIQVYNRPGYIPLIREASPRSKIILSLHNLVYDTLKVESLLAEAAFREADWIFTVSRFIAEDTAEKFPEAATKIQPLYTGVDLDDYSPIWSKRGRKWRNEIRSLYNLDSKDPVILFVGRLVPDKGCHLILAAMNEILKNVKHAKLLIVGSKWYADGSTSKYIEGLKQLAAEHEHSIVFASYVPVEEIPKYFAAADLFICPSQWKEPLARVHYEAMAAGLPVITTRRGGNHEVVRNGKNGIVIDDYKNPVAFAAASIDILNDPQKATAMGKAGRKDVKKIYNFDRVTSDIALLYTKLFESSEQGTNSSS